MIERQNWLHLDKKAKASVATILCLVAYVTTVIGAVGNPRHITIPIIIGFCGVTAALKLFHNALRSS